jgi:hypothetical protein
MMGNFNYQVGNGGFSQWSFNGYDEDLYELIKICDKGISFGLNDFQQMKELLVKFSEIEEPETWSENERCHYCCGSGTVEGYDEEGDETEEECDECGGDGTFEEEYNNHDDIQSEMEELNDPYYAIETMEQSMQELLNRL